MYAKAAGTGYSPRPSVTAPAPDSTDGQAPIVEEIKAWAGRQQGLPESTFRKAIKYMLDLWHGLTVFLSNPWVPLGGVGRWRGGVRSRGVAVTGRFRVLRRCLTPRHSSVSSARSSNRTCGFPASGSLSTVTPSLSSG